MCFLFFLEQMHNNNSEDDWHKRERFHSEKILDNSLTIAIFVFVDVCVCAVCVYEKKSIVYHVV